MPAQEPSDCLDPGLVELIQLKLAVSATYLHLPGVRRHIRRSLELGVSCEAIVEVVKLSTVIGIHSYATAAPILVEELDERAQNTTPPAPTPVCDSLRTNGRFNPEWEPIAALSPEWLEAFLAAAIGIWRDGVLPQLWIELLCIAGDAAVTHMYSSGTRRHIAAALELGATREQILAVLGVVSGQGRDAFEVAMPILDAEWARLERGSAGQ